MTPSLFRESFGNIAALRNLEISEISEARDTYSSNLIKDRFLNAFAPMMHGDDLNWLFFAHHVGKKTRLLDVTRNPLVALFFATGESLEDDGVVYITLSSNFRPVRRGYDDPLDARDYPIMPISYKELLNPSFDSRNTHDVPYLVFPELPQERILAQNGGFFFWKNPGVNFHDMRQAFPVIVDGSAKENIRRELESFGISEDVLFPNG